MTESGSHMVKSVIWLVDLMSVKLYYIQNLGSFWYFVFDAGLSEKGKLQIRSSMRDKAILLDHWHTKHWLILIFVVLIKFVTASAYKSILTLLHTNRNNVSQINTNVCKSGKGVKLCKNNFGNVQIRFWFRRRE